jgi:2-keto-3-deoxy-6-phosphogluconate aldolase
MPHVIVDPESASLKERFALIKTPRRSRVRFPAGCVTPVATEADARAGADLAKHLHAAVVYGPSLSSESQKIYYLVRWLD